MHLPAENRFYVMPNNIFVPLTDEYLYDHPEWITGPVIPYKTGQACYHWLAVELNPADDKAKHPLKHQSINLMHRELKVANG